MSNHAKNVKKKIFQTYVIEEICLFTSKQKLSSQDYLREKLQSNRDSVIQINSVYNKYIRFSILNLVSIKNG